MSIHAFKIVIQYQILGPVASKPSKRIDSRVRCFRHFRIVDKNFQKQR